MYADWTIGLTEEEKIEFEKEFKSAKPVLRQIQKVLDRKEIVLDRSEIDPKAYEVANWAYLQAHKNGYRQALQYLKQLCDPKENG